MKSKCDKLLFQPKRKQRELYRLLCASINATDRPKTKQKNVSMLKNQIQNREQQYYIYECAMCIGARNHLLYTNAKHTTATVPMEKDIHLEMETDLYFYLLSHFFFFSYFTIYFQSLCGFMNIEHSTLNTQTDRHIENSVQCTMVTIRLH